MAAKKPVKKKTVVVKKIRLNPKGLLGGLAKRTRDQDAQLNKLFKK